jgi:hypothetical protein
MGRFPGSADCYIPDADNRNIKFMPGQDSGIIHKITDTGNSTVNK